MKQILITAWLIVLLVLSFPIESCSQAKAKLVLPESTVSVRGTSSMHDWEVSFEKYDIDFSFASPDNGRVSFKDVKAVFSGASVASENTIMTGKARDALMVRDHPDIVFISGGTENITYNDGKIKGTLDGKLQLAGISRPIVFTFSGTIEGDRITIQGSEEVNMADYGIKPPTALLGALKTGEKVTVDMKLSFLVPGANQGGN